MIKSFKDLADHIAGKRILHLNSLGKDSAVCLEYLAKFARPSHVVSVYFKYLASHPDDDRYIRYQKARYPHVEFITRENGSELNNFRRGIFQSPIDIIREFNNWEYIEFNRNTCEEELSDAYNCDYICIGHSRYESMARAKKFYDNGLVIGNRIYPIGLMSKSDIFGIIERSGLKLHPTYKIAETTFDNPSYFKMRYALALSPEYRARVLKFYPLLKLDEYRYERLLNE